MVGKGLIPEGAAVDNGTSGIAAAIGMAAGNFALPIYTNDHPDLNFFHIPGKDGGSASFAGGDVIAIPSGTEH